MPAACAPARSLGVILYALCYSRLPFGADLSYEQLRKRIVDPAPPELPGAPRRCRRPHRTFSGSYTFPRVTFRRQSAASM